MLRHGWIFILSRETRTEKPIKSVRKLLGKEVKFMTAVMAVREEDSERPHRGRV